MAASPEWRTFLAAESSPAAHIRGLQLGSGHDAAGYFDGIHLEREAVLGSLVEHHPELVTAPGRAMPLQTCFVYGSQCYIGPAETVVGIDLTAQVRFESLFQSLAWSF